MKHLETWKRLLYVLLLGIILTGCASANGKLLMPVTVRLNHAIADGYLVANVFRLLQQEMELFVEKEA